MSRVKCLHFSDCLRANKSTLRYASISSNQLEDFEHVYLYSWGVELRVPFLDTDFVNHAMGIQPIDRMPLNKRILHSANGNGHIENDSDRRCIEKYILRAAFEGKRN